MKGVSFEGMERIFPGSSCAFDRDLKTRLDDENCEVVVGRRRFSDDVVLLKGEGEPTLVVMRFIASGYPLDEVTMMYGAIYDPIYDPTTPKRLVRQGDGPDGEYGHWAIIAEWSETADKWLIATLVNTVP